MHSYQISDTDLTVWRMAYGCMNLGGTWDWASLTSAGIAANRLDATYAHAAGALDYFRQHDILV